MDMDLTRRLPFGYIQCLVKALTRHIYDGAASLFTYSFPFPVQ